MKKQFSLIIFFLVMFSLASNIAAGVLLNYVKVEISEKDGKEVDNKSDFEKDKIFQDYSLAISCFSSRQIKKLHPAVKISSPTLGTEINPPDVRTA